MKNIFKISSIPVLSFLYPVLAYAQQSVAADPCASVEGLGNLICKAQQLLNAVIPLLIALGVVYFVWGVVQYFIGDNEEAKTKGRDRIIYGVIGLVVIISLWGLVYLVTNTFKIKGSAPTKTDLNKLLPQ